MNFSQSPAIYFELISFGVNFNSKITDKRAPLVSRRAPRRAHAAVHRCRVAAMRHADSAALSRCRDRASRIPTTPRTPRPPDRPLDAPARSPTASRSPLADRHLTPLSRLSRRPDSCLADRAIARTAFVPFRSPRSPLARRRHTALVSHRSPPSPMCRRRVVAGSPSSAAPAEAELGQGRACGPRTRAAHAAPAEAMGHAPCGSGPRPHCASGPRAISAQLHPINFINF
jgi:hypothetical protein